MIKIYSFRLCLTFQWVANAARKKLKISPCKRSLILFACGLLMSAIPFSQFPTVSEVAAKMKVGWNLGNTLEPHNGEDCWSLATTQEVTDAVTAASFNTIHIPTAWNS